MSLTIGSLFSGIGGLECGLERAGLGPVVWQCERDPFARSVLAHHWPAAHRFEDITTLEAPPYVDVLCGGFPCQDISLAGKGAGIADGTRSGLWSHYARLIRDVRPRYVVVENVAALLVRGLGRVLGDLAASGYDAEWDCIPASAVGAPHRRDRLFILAYTDAYGGGQQGITQLDSEQVEDSAERDSCGGHAHRLRNEVADTRGAGLPLPERPGWGEQVEATRREWGSTPERGWWTIEPPVGRVAHGVPGRVGQLRCLGNAVVPAVAEVIGRVIMTRERSR